MSDKVVLNSIDSAAFVTKVKSGNSLEELAVSIRKLSTVNDAWRKAMVKSLKDDGISMERFNISLQIFEGKLKWLLGRNLATTTDTSKDVSEQQQLGKLEPTAVRVNNIDNSTASVIAQPECSNIVHELLTQTQHMCEVPMSTSLS